MFVTPSTQPAATPQVATIQPVVAEHIRGQKQFEEMVIPRQVAGDKSVKQLETWTSIGREIERDLLTVTDQEIEEFLSVLDTLDFKQAPADSVLKSQKLYLIALEALRRGLLHPEHGQMQVATVLNFWAAMQYYGQPLATISTTEQLQQEAPGTDVYALLTKVEMLPPSERHFLDVSSIACNTYNTIIEQIEATGVKTFPFSTMVPSVGMMQAFLDANFGEEAVTLKPRLYLSTFRHIYETRLTDTCDMMMPTPDAHGKSRCPEEADKFPAPWHCFTYHDFYHAIIASAVGKKYRPAGTVAADAMRQYALSVPAQEQKGLRTAANVLVEAEHPLFRRDHPTYNLLTDAERFWISIDFRLAQFQFITDDGYVSPDNLLFALEAIYNAFVKEQKGPPELTQESFDKALLFLKEQSGGGLRLAGVSFHLHPLVVLKMHLMAKEIGLPPESASYYSSKIKQLINRRSSC